MVATACSSTDGGDPGCRVWNARQADVQDRSEAVRSGEVEANPAAETKAWREAAAETAELTEDRAVRIAALDLVDAIDEDRPWLAEDGEMFQLDFFCASR